MELYERLTDYIDKQFDPHRNQSMKEEDWHHLENHLKTTTAEEAHRQSVSAATEMKVMARQALEEAARIADGPEHDCRAATQVVAKTRAALAVAIQTTTLPPTAQGGIDEVLERVRDHGQRVVQALLEPVVKSETNRLAEAMRMHNDLEADFAALRIQSQRQLDTDRAWAAADRGPAVLSVDTLDEIIAVDAPACAKAMKKLIGSQVAEAFRNLAKRDADDPQAPAYGNQVVSRIFDDARKLIDSHAIQAESLADPRHALTKLPVAQQEAVAINLVKASEPKGVRIDSTYPVDCQLFFVSQANDDPLLRVMRLQGRTVYAAPLPPGQKAIYGLAIDLGLEASAILPFREAYGSYFAQQKEGVTAPPWADYRYQPRSELIVESRNRCWGRTGLPVQLGVESKRISYADGNWRYHPPGGGTPIPLGATRTDAQETLCKSTGRDPGLPSFAEWSQETELVIRSRGGEGQVLDFLAKLDERLAQELKQAEPADRMTIAIERSALKIIRHLLLTEFARTKRHDLIWNKPIDVGTVPQEKNNGQLNSSS